MKEFMIYLGLVYLGGFVFYCAVVLWFNRPSLRRQLAVLHNLNDGNVAYSNGLNAKIRDMGDKLQQNANTIKELTEANQLCWFDAVEQGNVISMYDEAAGENRLKIENLEKVNQADFDTIALMRTRLADAHRETDKFRKQAEDHKITINAYNKLLNEAQDAVNESQVEVRKATEALEFLKSELVMAERQLERLS